MDTTTILRDLNVFVIDDDKSPLGHPKVWILTADTFTIGNRDLDNETLTHGVYANLAAAAGAILRLSMRPEGHFYNPVLTQMPVLS
jgi:hypothetical protein